MHDELKPLPTQLRWLVEPVSWETDSEGMIRITAGVETDMFHDPAGDGRKADAAAAVFTPNPLFSLSALVGVEFASTYDAGALLVWADADHWGKLCYEYSPQRQPMVVSVVTNDRSDDCNSPVFARSNIYLRVSRVGRSFAFHYSEDGKYWHLVRHFALHSDAPIQAGFVAQSPTGQGCTATFTEIAYAPVPVRQIRSGE